MTNAIKAARLASKLTVKQAASLLHVPKRTLEEWEAGRRNPKRGIDYYAELISAFGIFTADGLRSIEDGTLSPEEVLAEYRISQAMKLSKWGRYSTTWHRAFERIPDVVYPKLTAEDIAALVDAFVECYGDGKNNR